MQAFSFKMVIDGLLNNQKNSQTTTLRFFSYLKLISLS
jgi:hypothetical protein